MVFLAVTGIMYAVLCSLICNKGSDSEHGGEPVPDEISTKDKMLKVLLPSVITATLVICFFYFYMGGKKSAPSSEGYAFGESSGGAGEEGILKGDLMD